MNWLKKIFGSSPLKDADRRDAITAKLLADRIIFLGTPIDDRAAEEVIARMLFLEDAAPGEDINLYINSPGGSIPAAMAIYDTIKCVKPDVATMCIGRAGGTAAIIQASGSRGKRFAQPASEFLFFKVKMRGDKFLMPPAARRERRDELKKMNRLIVETLVAETGQPPKNILAAMRENAILSANQAAQFGLIDAVINK